VIIPAPGTNWSIAGMVASLCSVPLKPYYGNNMGSKSRFLPSLTCLGDILKAQGYEQYFITGPKLKFSGMDTFYLDHGYDVTIGRDE
jgi:phosphoglycerol transferase